VCVHVCLCVCVSVCAPDGQRVVVVIGKQLDFHKWRGDLLILKINHP